MKGILLKAVFLIATMSATFVAVYSYSETITYKFNLGGSPPYASYDSYPLKLLMELSKTHYFRWEPLEILCKFKNIGAEPITIIFPCLWFTFVYGKHYSVYFDYIITDTIGTEIFKWSYGIGCPGMLDYHTLYPGEERSTKFLFWFQRFKSPDGAEMHPCTYKIKAEMPPSGYSFAIKGEQSVGKLETPPITFTIN